MDKQEFLAQLRTAFAGLPRKEMEERLNFYSEMIDDRMEEGLTEAEAVAAAGSVEEIAAQTADTPGNQDKKKYPNPGRRLTGGEITLLILGSPLWLPFGIAVFAVVLSLYISLWAVILSLWAVFLALALCAAAGVLSFVLLTAGAHPASGVFLLAAGIACAGLSIFMFFGCQAAVKGTCMLTKKTAAWIRNCFVPKEVLG